MYTDKYMKFYFGQYFFENFFKEMSFFKKLRHYIYKYSFSSLEKKEIVFPKN